MKNTAYFITYIYILYYRFRLNNKVRDELLFLSLFYYNYLLDKIREKILALY